MSYTDVFGSQTLPPSDYGYVKLTVTTDTAVAWPYNADSTATVLAKITEVDCQSGNKLTLPDATQVSVGEDILIRNVGSNTLIVNNAAGVQIATVAVGAASYFYLTDNTSVAGIFSVVGFGVGTSSVDAASLVGYGIKALGASLNQSHPVLPVASATTLDNTHRASLVVFTGGASTFALTAAATLGNDYFVLIRNDGTGTLTIDPASSETIDGLSTLQLQPSESLFLICTGTAWYSVGYGRSTLYQFTQLTKDVSAGGTITLSAAEAANKLVTFIGNPSGAVTVIVPAVVAVYYTYSAISTAHTITVKTSAGSGASIDQGSRIIVLCDGTNVLSAQSATSNTSLSLSDGSLAVPSLFFATKTNTGLYKYGTDGIGFSINGVDMFHMDTAGGINLPNPTINNLVVTGAFSLTGDQVQVSEGGTGATTASGARTNLGISAANTPFTPVGGLAAADVQSALAELDSEKQALIGTISGLVKGNGANALTAAIAGTDYLAPAAIGVTVQGYDADTAKTDVQQTFTATQIPDNGTASVSTTSTYTFDGADQVREITLTNAITVTFGAPTGIVQHAMYKFILKAGDTSARTFAWNAAYKFPAAVSPLASGTVTSGAFDVISFIGGASNTLIYQGSVADVR